LNPHQAIILLERLLEDRDHLSQPNLLPDPGDVKSASTRRLWEEKLSHCLHCLPRKYGMVAHHRWLESYSLQSRHQHKPGTFVFENANHYCHIDVRYKDDMQQMVIM
jgi:hypothetical protein